MKRTVKIIGLCLLIGIFLIGALVLFLLSTSGQEFLTQNIKSYLQKKLQTRVEIQHIRYEIPNWIALEGFYLEDKSKDTLVAGNRVLVRMNMQDLLHNQLTIQAIEADNLHLKVKRTLPDTTFNFAYILNTFSSPTPQKPDNSPPLNISLSKIKANNLSIKYVDDVTGSDAKLFFKTVETSFDKINPTRSQYHLSNIFVAGTQADIRLYEAPAPRPAQVSLAKDSLDLAIGKIQISDFNWKALMETAGIGNSGKINDLQVEFDKIWLYSQQIKLKNAFLNQAEISTVFVKNKQATKTNLVPPTKNGVTKPWTFIADHIQSKSVDVQVNDETKPFQKTGLDFAHLDLKNINFDLKELAYQKEELSGKLTAANFTEKSGLQLDDFHSDFFYSPRQTALKDFYLKTPNTVIKQDLLLQYNSLEQLSKDLGNVSLDARVSNSQIATKDILMLAPDLAKMPAFSQNKTDVLNVDGIIKGKINNLTIPKFSFKGFGETQLQAQGRISGLPNFEQLLLDVQVTNFSGTKKDLLKMVSDTIFPKSIELPTTFQLAGTVKGKMADLALNTQLSTDFGKASFVGNLTNITAKTNQKYDGVVALDDFDMGKLMKMPAEKMGEITLNAQLKGNGIDPKTAQAHIDGSVQKAFLQGYEYKNLALTGDLSNQIADVKARLNDENAQVVLNAKVNLANPTPAIDSKIQIARLDLQKLHLYADTLLLKGNIEANFSSTGPANPIGKLILKNGFLNNIPLSNASLVAQNTASGSKLLTIDSPFLKAALQGNFDYLQLQDIFMTELNKYFATPDFPYKNTTEPYSFSANAVLVNHPFIQAFLPKLRRLDSTRITALLQSQGDTTLKFVAFAPDVQYDSSQVQALHLQAVGTGKNLAYKGDFSKFTYGTHPLGNTILDGNVADNLLKFRLFLKDSIQQNQYALAGNVFPYEKNFRLKLQENVLMNYQKWRTDSTAFIEFGKEGYWINHFILQQNEQKLVINSTKPEPKAPIEILSNHLQLDTFLKFLQQDTLLASGQLDGNLTLSNLQTSPLFTGDMTIKDFNFSGNSIGDLHVNSFNESASKIIAKATLLSNKNDILLDGNYDLSSKNPLDFDLNIRQLGAKTIEAFSFGQLLKSRGNVNGKIHIKGSTNLPQFDGELHFDSVAFTLAKLGAGYRIDNDKLFFEGQQIKLKQFVLKDSTGQNLLVNGNVNFAKPSKIAYNFNVQTKDFTVLDATAKENDFFYGKGFVDAKMNIKGVGMKATIDGDVKVREPSNITVVMPNDAAQAEATDGIVLFVNKSGQPLVATDSTEVEKSTGFSPEISLNLEATEKSEMTIIIDPINGDNIKAKGNAQLTAGRTAQGQNYVFGSYDISEGTYNLTYQLIQKAFTIQKGSNIIWTGDPMQAMINITAVYNIDVPPMDLVTQYARNVEQGSNMDEYQKKVPLNVILKMNGSLANPQVSFDLKRNTAKTNFDWSNTATAIDDALVNLRGKSGDSTRSDAQSADLSKQVFSLLVLNSFFPEKIADLLSNNNPEAIARQSVSKILSDQLNQLATNLIKGVQVDFNLNSTTSANIGSTNLNVGLSKGFLNNRLTVTVGRNFELENNTDTGRNPAEIFDNISLNYKLSEDGRYLFRAYRKNEYTVLDGFVINTGLSFRVTTEYDKFKEIFQRK